MVQITSYHFLAHTIIRETFRSMRYLCVQPMWLWAHTLWDGTTSLHALQALNDVDAIDCGIAICHCYIGSGIRNENVSSGFLHFIPVCHEMRNCRSNGQNAFGCCRKAERERERVKEWEQQKVVTSRHRNENHNEEISVKNMAFFLAAPGVPSLFHAFRVCQSQTKHGKSIFFASAKSQFCVQSLLNRPMMVSDAETYRSSIAISELMSVFFAFVALFCLVLCILHAESVAFDCVCSFVGITNRMERETYDSAMLKQQVESSSQAPKEPLTWADFFCRKKIRAEEPVDETLEWLLWRFHFEHITCFSVLKRAGDRFVPCARIRTMLYLWIIAR